MIKLLGEHGFSFLGPMNFSLLNYLLHYDMVSNN